MRNKKIAGIIFLSLLVVAGLIGIASALNATVCCEKTVSGMSCQDVAVSQCAAGAKQAPTSCKATSYCKPGTCYDSNEGTCLDNTPQNVCNANKGIWSEKPVAQCELACCVLGDQAAFVTLTRCKKLSAFLGLETNYKKEIKNEVACIASVLNLEKGACVYESDFKRVCKFTTRADCSATGGVNKTKTEFYAKKLCSAEELGTTCGPTTKTICVPGKEEVYFADTCGNPANIYDASKVNDKAYWGDVKDKTEACNPNSANANSATCGNCNYLLGSFCRDKTKAGAAVAYGSYACADLNCKKTVNGKSYKHGESWCVNDEKINSVGSGFFKHICINGEEVLEACADYKNHECIESSIPTSVGAFAQAACRVNRWEDCVIQTAKIDCENADKRDCTWNAAVEKGRCVPKNPPGLKFWDEEAKITCEVANRACKVTLETGFIGGKSKECTSSDCGCYNNDGKRDYAWDNQQIAVCKSMGDCGPKTNWIGEKGYKGDNTGYTVT